jgi:hypothetical protein
MGYILKYRMAHNICYLREMVEIFNFFNEEIDIKMMWSLFIDTLNFLFFIFINCLDHLQ